MKTLLFLLAFTGSVLASGILYTYQCPRCGLVQQYTRTGMYHCPNDKMLMFQVRDR